MNQKPLKFKTMKKLITLIAIILTISSCTKEEYVTNLVTQFEIKFEQDKEFYTLQNEHIIDNNQNRLLNVRFEKDQIVFTSKDYEIAYIIWDEYLPDLQRIGSKRGVLSFKGIEKMLKDPDQEYTFKVGFYGDLYE